VSQLVDGVAAAAAGAPPPPTTASPAASAGSGSIDGTAALIAVLRLLELDSNIARCVSFAMLV
jgi:hypothetical protein